MVLPRVMTACGPCGVWDTGGCGTTNITVPWGTADPTSSGGGNPDVDWGRIGFGPACVCICTGAWTKAEIIPVRPLTGNTWHRTGDPDTGGEEAVEEDMGEDRVEDGANDDGGLMGHNASSSLPPGGISGAFGGSGGMGVVSEGDVGWVWPRLSAVWRMTLVAMALLGGARQDDAQ